MDQFEYVMVLVSIIIGLGIAHILLGVGGIFDRISGRGERLELSIAHAFWLGFCFMWMVMFWWWEYRFSSRVSEWTMGLYLFLVVYAVILFLMAVVLVPRSWDGVTSLRSYFLRQRVWFYGLIILMIVTDQIDSYLKGGVEYILEIGALNIAFSISIFVSAFVGIKSENVRFHNFVSVLFFSWQLLIGLQLYDMLAI
jgi:hypothetical protein